MMAFVETFLHIASGVLLLLLFVFWAYRQGGSQ